MWFFFSNNNNHHTPPAAVLYNAIVIAVDLLFLFVKFWFRTAVEIYEAFTTEERDVSKDTVLITGTVSAPHMRWFDTILFLNFYYQGHGIGKELALQYSALGATVVCWDINEQLNIETVKLIKSKGGKAHGYTWVFLLSFAMIIIIDININFLLQILVVLM